MSRNKRLSAARAWMHGQVCASGCGAVDNDHARRVHPDARAYVDAPSDTARLEALHRLFCLGAMRGDCGQQDQHLAVIAKKVQPDIESAIGGPA